MEGRNAWSARVQAGLIGGLLATIFSISHASLVVGAAAPHALSTVMGMALVATASLNFLFGVFGRIRGAVLAAQDVPSAAIGAILVTVVADRVSATPAITIAEIVALNVAACLVFGLSLFMSGMFRLAAIMRYAPSPVLAGFLAGTGYFISVGALAICLGEEIAADRLGDLVQPPVSGKILVALGVAFALSIATRALTPSLSIGAVIGGAILAFHAVAAFSGVGDAALTEAGWFVQVREGGLVWPPVSPAELGAVGSGFIVDQLVPLCVMVVLSTAALLMMTSAVETATRTDVGLDRELKVVGLSNVAIAALGGMPGYPGMSATMAALRVANGHRLITLVSGGVVLAVFLLGNTILALLPLPVFAGFLLWIGLGFLRSWLVDEIRRTTRGEGVLTAAIFLVVVVFGLFEGTIFGLVAGGFLFVVNYSRLNPVRGTLLSDTYLGATEFSPAEQRLLRDHGARIAILKLQGYVFFGTAHRIRDHVKALIADQKVTRLILDFEAVTGLDATAVDKFRRIASDLEDAGAEATFTALGEPVRQTFEDTQFAFGADARCRVAQDLDTALLAYQCEILAEFSDADPAPFDLQSLLSAIFRDAPAPERFGNYLERLHIAAGQTLISEGEQASDIFLVESGQFEVLIGDELRRVRILRPGAVIGEISYYGGGRRTSTIRATEPAVVWRFSSDMAKKVFEEDPHLSSQFHAGIAAILAERVTANTRLIRMLMA